MFPVSCEAHFQDLKAAYEHIQEQLPTSPGAKQDVWLYVLPIQGRMRQTHSSEASESLAMPSFSREQQQRRIEAQRSCENLLEASSAQAHLHRLSMDMGASYHSPRQLDVLTPSPSKLSQDGGHQRPAPSLPGLQGTPYDVSGHPAHAGRRSLDAPLHRGRPDVPTLDLRASPRKAALLRQARTHCQKASEGAERLWPLTAHGGPWGATFPPAQPMLTSDATSPQYYSQTQQGGFCGGPPPTGGYSPFQAGAHDPMDRTPRLMEAAQQLPGSFLRGGPERQPPLFSAAGRVPLQPNQAAANSGDSANSGSGASLVSPEGTFRPHTLAPPDPPFRARALMSAHSDADAYFPLAAAAAVYANNLGREPFSGDPPYHRMHSAHAAQHRAAGLRHVGSAPGELRVFGQPPATTGPVPATAAAATAEASSERPERQREVGPGWHGCENGQLASSAPAATSLSRGGSSRGSSPLISPTNNPSTNLAPSVDM
ncbi:hypothetical protein WJX75_002412 [Coccomyxa subellipsoidea]|uniref:Uncharacterized protein n=1 Tax=Coccomyxa subellipsoidea TaxID=248742 RepID=A0ABR2YC32_9CHLO